MKFVLVLAVLLSFPSAFADNYVCVIEGTDDTLTLIKGKELVANDGEDYRAEYNVQIQTTELPFPHTSLMGIAVTADVHFYFESLNKSVSVSLYLDDGNGSATINGEEKVLENCQLIQ